VAVIRANTAAAVIIEFKRILTFVSPFETMASCNFLDDRLFASVKRVKFNGQRKRNFFDAVIDGSAMGCDAGAGRESKFVGN